MSRHLSVVLTPSEVHSLLNNLNGTMDLVASLLYGTGLQLLEGLRLRVKDVEFKRREIVVRYGKGGKDSATVLPLQQQLAAARTLHDEHLQRGGSGAGAVWLPDALAVKYPSAPRACSRQQVVAVLEAARKGLAVEASAAR